MGARCLFCGKEDDLTTTMAVTIDGKNYNVSICAADEDKATPSSVRQTLSKELAELDALRAKAASLGYNMVPNTPMPQKSNSSPPTSQPQLETPTQLTPSPRLKPQTSQKQGANKFPSANPSQNAPGPTRIVRNMDEAKDTTKELQRIDTMQGGRPIIIPQRTEGLTGTTEIVVVATDDREIQKRMRYLNEDNAPDHRTQYSVRDCPVCNGTLKDMSGKNCQKCGGKGIITI